MFSVELSRDPRTRRLEPLAQEPLGVSGSLSSAIALLLDTQSCQMSHSNEAVWEEPHPQGVIAENHLQEERTLRPFCQERLNFWNHLSAMSLVLECSVWKSMLKYSAHARSDAGMAASWTWVFQMDKAISIWH